jgi:DNA-binding MarR family transcriptional regulator
VEDAERKSGVRVDPGRLLVEARQAQWRAAMRWRRRVEATLANADLTFTQWLVLDALQVLIDEAEDAVSQNEVCSRLELDRSTISAVMRLLQEKQLVSRGIDITGRACRVFLTDTAEALLGAYSPSISEACAASCEDKPAFQAASRRDR